MNNSTLERTINRKKRKAKTNRLVNNILNTLKAAKQPMATQEIADATKKPWHTIQTRCLRLQIENKLTGFRVGRINLWQIKE